MGHIQQNNTMGLKSMELKYHIIESQSDEIDSLGVLFGNWWSDASILKRIMSCQQIMFFLTFIL